MLVRPFIQPIAAFDVANSNGVVTIGVLGGGVINTINYEIYNGITPVYSSSISVTDKTIIVDGEEKPIDGIRNFNISVTSAMGLTNNNSYTIRVYTQNTTEGETSGYSSVQYFSCYVTPSVSLKDGGGNAVGNNYEFTTQSGNLYVDFSPNDSDSPVILNSIKISIQGYNGDGYSEIYNSGMVYTPFTINFDNLTPTGNDNSEFTQYRLILTAETVQGMQLSSTYTGLTCNYTITSATDILSVENNASEGNIKVSMNLSTINGVADPAAAYTQVSDTKYNLDRTASGSKVTFANQFNVTRPYEIKFWFKPNASGDVIAQFLDNGDTYSLTYTLENGTTPTFTLSGGSITAVSGTTENESSYYYVSVVALLGGFSVTVKNAYLASFETDGGIPETNSVYTNEIVQMPTDPEKEGYTFSGWYYYKYFIDEAYLALKSAILSSTIEGQTIPNETLDMLSSVKGNTKKFNQLVRNGNFEDSQYWGIHSTENALLNISNNKGTITIVSAGNGYQRGIYNKPQSEYRIVGHKYIIKCYITASVDATFKGILGNANSDNSVNISAGQRTEVAFFVTALYQTRDIIVYPSSNMDVNDYYVVEYMNAFDLTAMGLDSITTVEEFTALYPKAYYEYNAGTLYDSVVSGVSLTGRNLANVTQSMLHSGYYYDSSGTPAGANANYIRIDPIDCLPNTQYTISCNLAIYSLYYFNGSTKILLEYGSSNTRVRTFTTPADCNKIRISLYNTSGSADTVAFQWLMLNLGSTALPYVPYKAHQTISLPSTQTLGGLGTSQDEIQVTKNTNDDYYTIKKLVRKQQGALSTIPQWNQRFTKSTQTKVVSEITYTPADDGSITAIGTATGDSYYPLPLFSAISGHKYYLRGCPTGGSSTTYRIFGGGFAFPIENRINDTGNGHIKEAANSGTAEIVIYVYPAAGTVNLTFKPNVFDLTAIFGAGNEPTTVADIPQWIKDKDYFDYKAIGSEVDTTIMHNYLYNNDDDVAWTSSVATETTITETATLAEVSAIRENGGMISVVGNTNEDYTQPNVTMGLHTKETVQLPFQMTENTKFFADYTQN